MSRSTLNPSFSLHLFKKAPKLNRRQTRLNVIQTVMRLPLLTFLNTHFQMGEVDPSNTTNRFNGLITAPSFGQFPKPHKYHIPNHHTSYTSHISHISHWFLATFSGMEFGAFRRS